MKAGYVLCLLVVGVTASQAADSKASALTFWREYRDSDGNIVNSSVTISYDVIPTKRLFVTCTGLSVSITSMWRAMSEESDDFQKPGNSEVSDYIDGASDKKLEYSLECLVAKADTLEVTVMPKEELQEYIDSVPDVTRYHFNKSVN